MRDHRMDGIRVVSILLVVIFHALVIFEIDVRSFRLVVGAFFQTFFLGSGFFITKILLRGLNENGGFDLKSFYIRRILRTWPLYFVGLLLHWLLEIPEGGLWKYFVFIQNFFDENFYRHSWSVAVEEQFYIVSPLIVLFMFRSSRPLVAFLAILAAVVCLRDSMEVFFHAGKANHTLLWIDGLLLGVFLALPSSKRWLELIKKHYLWIHVIAPPACWYLANAHKTLGSLYNLLWPLLIAIFFASTLSERSPIGRLFSNRLFQFLTPRTYSIYIFHIVPLAILQRSVPMEAGLSAQKAVVILASLGSVFLLAECAYRLIDRPVLGYRDRKYPEVRAGHVAQ